MQQTENLERHFDPLEFAFLRRRHGIAIRCYAMHRLLWEYQDIMGLDEALPYFPAILAIFELYIINPGVRLVHILNH